MHPYMNPLDGRVRYTSSVRYFEREKLHPQTTEVEGWRMCHNIMGLFIRWRFFFQVFYFLKGKVGVLSDAL